MKKISLKSLKRKAIKHYDEMIAWAEKQHKSGQIDSDIMNTCIRQNWSGKYCAFCQRFENCNNCPLEDKKYYDIRYHCCKGFWKKMNDSKTWSSWLKYAKKIRQMIQNLPDEYER